MKTFRCTFGPIRPTDFVWPPPPADLEGVSVVRHSEEPANLDEEYTVVRLSEELDADGNPANVSEEDVRLHPADATFVEEVSSAAVEIPPPLPPPVEVDVPTQPITPLSVATGRPLYPLIPDDQAELYYGPEEQEAEDENEDAQAFFIPPSPEPPAEPERARGTGFAWAAVFAAISCAAVAYSEFQAGRREAIRPPIAESVPSPDLPAKLASRDIVLEPSTMPLLPSADVPPAPPEVPPASPARTRAAEPKRRPEPEPEPRVVMRAASVTPSRPAPSRPMPAPPAAPAPAPQRTAAAAPAPARESAQVTAPAPTTLALAMPPASPAAEPVVHTAALDTSAEAAAAAADEEHIESTLTRFRTAYSKLDARAAREVWPSVDVEALDRAFRGLKSQELRFDRCDLTVDGARARAACRGRAVYVPRVGNQSPKAAPREWTFELRKSDQRWTIASARSS